VAVAVGRNGMNARESALTFNRRKVSGKAVSCFRSRGKGAGEG